MITYKKTNDLKGNYCGVFKLENGEQVLSIPANKSNRDYQEYLEWLAEGNTPEEAE